MTPYNIKLGYLAGCGGFLALHLLLQSGRHKCWFDQDVNKIIDQQWNIVDHTKWKSTECWPSNEHTRALEGNTILFYCNPQPADWLGIEHKIFLYSDLTTQLTMAKYKNAWIYLPSVDRSDLTLDHVFRQLYRNLRDYSWPECDSIKQSRTLPEHILRELDTHSDYQALLTANSWEQWWVSSVQNTVVNNCIVTPECAMFVDTADQALTLQEMVNSQGQALLGPLGLVSTDTHKTLIKRWIQLHPPNLLESIGINIF
jgi:hypothetical protein